MVVMCKSNDDYISESDKGLTKLQIEKAIWNPIAKANSINEQEVLQIKRPPCKSCKNWNPITKYGYSIAEKKNIIAGTVLCHAAMKNDFSCFVATEKAIEKYELEKQQEDAFEEFVQHSNKLIDCCDEIYDEINDIKSNYDDKLLELEDTLHLQPYQPYHKIAEKLITINTHFFEEFSRYSNVIEKLGEYNSSLYYTIVNTLDEVNLGLSLLLQPYRDKIEKGILQDNSINTNIDFMNDADNKE